MVQVGPRSSKGPYKRKLGESIREGNKTKEAEGGKTSFTDGERGL